MKPDIKSYINAVPELPTSNAEMCLRVTEAKRTVDCAIEVGLINSDMRAFFLGLAYADREGLEVELAMKACGFPVPFATPALIKSQYKEVEAELNVPGDVTPWAAFDGPFGIEIEGLGVGLVVLEQTFDDGKTAIPVNSEGAADPVQFSGMVSTTCNSQSNGSWRLRLAKITSGQMVARLIQT